MFATANPVAQTETMMVTVPQGVQPRQLIQINCNGQMLNVQVPEGVSEGMQFHVQVPAAPQVAVAVATPVMAPVAAPMNQQPNQPTRLGEADDQPVQAYAPIGMDDPVVQAKIMRTVELDRKTTNAPWAVLFVVALVFCNLIGFWEVNNAMDVANERSETLAAHHKQGDMDLWCGHESSASGAQYHCEIRSVHGPSTTGHTIPPGVRLKAKTCDQLKWGKDGSKDFCAMPNVKEPTKGINGQWSLEKCRASSSPPPPPSAGNGRRALQNGRTHAGNGRTRQNSREAHEPVPASFVGHDGKSVDYNAGTNTPDQASSGVTWKEANDACSGIGARLCTLDELGKFNSLMGAASGCGNGAVQPWALDSCDGGHTCYDGTSQSCTSDCAKRRIRCCAYKDTNIAQAAERRTEAFNNVTIRDEDNEQVDMSSVVSPALTAVFVGLIFAVISGIAYIQGLRQHPRCLTWFANLLFPTLMLLAALAMLSTGVLFIFGIIMLILALVCFVSIFHLRLNIQHPARIDGNLTLTLFYMYVGDGLVLAGPTGADGAAAQNLYAYPSGQLWSYWHQCSAANYSVSAPNSCSRLLHRLAISNRKLVSGAGSRGLR